MVPAYLASFDSAAYNQIIGRVMISNESRSSLDIRTSITNANTPRIAAAAVVIIAANDHWRQVRLAHIVRR